MSNNDTGDVACNSYNAYQDDIVNLQNLRVLYIVLLRDASSWLMPLDEAVASGGVFGRRITRGQW